MTAEDDVNAVLDEIRRRILSGDYEGALKAITAAEKAWDVEVEAWAQELLAAEKEINSR